MSSAADDLCLRQIELLGDDEKLRLVELIANKLALRNGGKMAGQPSSAVDHQAARDRFR